MLLDKLEEVAEVNVGQPLLFLWVEAVREFLEDRKGSNEGQENLVGTAQVCSTAIFCRAVETSQDTG